MFGALGHIAIYVSGRQASTAALSTVTRKFSEFVHVDAVRAGRGSRLYHPGTTGNCHLFVPRHKSQFCAMSRIAKPGEPLRQRSPHVACTAQGQMAVLGHGLAVVPIAERGISKLVCGGAATGLPNPGSAVRPAQKAELHRAASVVVYALSQ